MAIQTSLEARAAVEALRMGVVNRRVIRHITYGREEELQDLRGHIIKHPQGTCRVLVGGYGMGKSHLCEALALNLLNSGFAVARIELGSSHGRPNHPRAVVRAIEQAISVSLDGRIFHGINDLPFVIRAIPDEKLEPFTSDDGYWVREQISAIHDGLRGRKQLLKRIDTLREYLPSIWGEEGYTDLPEMSISDEIPTPMTAANLAVACINRLAHGLHSVGVPGLVLIFDEAERAEISQANMYHIERATTLMLGFAMASANKDTTGLRHYRNGNAPYRPFSPSRIHSIFAFSYPWGLSENIAQRTSTRSLVLPRLNKAFQWGVQDKVLRLYEEAYGKAVSISRSDMDILERHCQGEDIRSFVRGLIAALDNKRLRHGRS